MKHNIDQLAKAALDRYEVAYEPAHWKLMEQRLHHHEKSRRSTVFFAKGVEALLMLTTLFALVQYAQMNLATPPAAPADLHMANTTTTVETASKVAAMPTTSTTDAVKAGTLPARSTPNIYTKRKIRASASTNAAVKVVDKTETPNTTNTAPVDAVPAAPQAFMPADPLLSKFNTLRDDQDPKLKAAKLYFSAMDVANTPTGKFEQSPKPRESDINSTIISPANEATSTPIETILTLPITPLPQKPTEIPVSLKPLHNYAALPTNGEPPYEDKRAKVKFGVKISGGPDYNTLDQAWLTASVRQNGFGQSGGLRFFAKLLPRVRLQTGVGVANKVYHLADLNLESNSPTQHIAGITQTLLELPIETDVTLYENKSWRAFLTLGASWLTTLNSSYHWDDNATTTYQLGQPASTQPDNFQNATRNLLVGSLNENSYWATTVGVGIERRISSKGSIFIMPTLQQGWKSTTSRTEKITSLALTMGGSMMF